MTERCETVDINKECSVDGSCPALIGFVAVSRLLHLERNIKAAGRAEGGLVSHPLQFLFEFPAPPTHHQKLRLLPAMTMAKRTQNVVFFRLHNDSHLFSRHLYCIANHDRAQGAGSRERVRGAKKKLSEVGGELWK